MALQPKRESLQALIDDALAETPPGRVVWVALSGGLDSSLLLTLAAQACRRYPRPLHALHVHHGLQDAADDFAQHCHWLASRLGVPLHVERVKVDLGAGKGLEGAAREARYAAFARRVSQGETLWLAQHQDDQAETFLLAALRGSGMRGLAGMPRSREWQGRRLERPLLARSRAELEAEGERLGLRWIDDPSNDSEALDRNFLRHRVLPALQSRWPHAAQALASSAVHAGEGEALLGELATQDLAGLGGEPGRLPVAPLSLLSLPRQRLLLRHCCERLGLSLPPLARLDSLLTQLGARNDAQVRVNWAEVEARIWRDHLYLRPHLAPLPADWRVDWSGVEPLATPWGRVKVSLSPAESSPVRLTLMPRRGGERLRLPGRGSRDLKRLLQEAGMPPWERERVLVAWSGEEPVAALRLDRLAWLVVAEGWRASPGDAV
ncbi:tRNA lysidine(34) synthetase TilS [Billgrantia kenyensis]|uniref:tRNA(Ile)-lysidine synthase n=1 Tax=Billgrantia kenyensis TaxID=321266 RepID=A0A7V9VZ63_9GAMM|nr:tRNA lysidine(34) synthetase TilS [Halomonas kenyensis]MBA2778123.1 tRNA lysidine(34) synthetase TilS [Halomonas kenyensis]MCG6661098.1 tRNA lysidine(34) synthetase TilS [Halomonas kenyensis]